MMSMWAGTIKTTRESFVFLESISAIALAILTTLVLVAVLLAVKKLAPNSITTASGYFTALAGSPGVFAE